MKKKEKRLILILVIITLVVIVIAVVTKRNNNETETTSSSGNSSSSTGESDTEGGSEYVTTLSDGTKLNTSSKLNETKTLGGLEITDIQLTESGNMTQLLATITNTSSGTEGGYTATLTLVDENGETLIELKPYIPELEAGESTQLNTSVGFDYSDAYDFTITK